MDVRLLRNVIWSHLFPMTQMSDFVLERPCQLFSVTEHVKVLVQLVAENDLRSGWDHYLGHVVSMMSTAGASVEGGPNRSRLDLYQRSSFTTSPAVAIADPRSIRYARCLPRCGFRHLIQHA